MADTIPVAPDGGAQMSTWTLGEDGRMRRQMSAASKPIPAAADSDRAAGYEPSSAHVCDLGLPCGLCLRSQRNEVRRSTPYVPPRRYRNTEGLHGHNNARKRARN